MLLWTIDRAATDWTVWPYDSLPARKMSFDRSGKTLTQHCSSLCPLCWVRVANDLSFRVRRAATWALSPEWRKTIWPSNTSFQFLKFSFINKRWTFIWGNKQLSWKITWLMTSCPSFGHEKNYQVEHYFTANFLCRVIKGWLSTALGLVFRLCRSCS